MRYHTFFPLNIFFLFFFSNKSFCSFLYSRARLIILNNPEEQKYFSAQSNENYLLGLLLHVCPGFRFIDTIWKLLKLLKLSNLVSQVLRDSQNYLIVFSTFSTLTQNKIEFAFYLQTPMKYFIIHEMKIESCWSYLDKRSHCKHM